MKVYVVLIKLRCIEGKHGTENICYKKTGIRKKRKIESEVTRRKEMLPKDTMQ